MRPTARAVILVGSSVPVSLLIAVAAPGVWVLGLAYLAGGLAMILVDRMMSPRVADLRVEHDLPPVLYIGASDPFELTVTPLAGRRATTIELALDTGPLLERTERQRALLPPDAGVRFELPLTPLRRGTARVERFWLRWQGPLGLVWQGAIEQLDVEIPVVPNVRAVRAAAIEFYARDAMIGQKSQNQFGDGSDFDALREWVPGLDGRGVDWKHSARHMKLVCKEFRAERNHNIILAFDTGHLMSEPLDGVPRMDRAINAGLLLAYASLREGDRVGLFGFDAQVRLYAEPWSGVQNFPRVQHASAGLEYRPEETNYTLALTHLLSRLNRRSLIVLMTDFVDTVTAEMMLENIGRLSRRHLVMFVSFVDPALKSLLDASPAAVADMARATVAGDFVRERAVVMERLARLGVHCLDCEHDRIGIDMINRYLMIKQRELI